MDGKLPVWPPLPHEMTTLNFFLQCTVNDKVQRNPQPWIIPRSTARMHSTILINTKNFVAIVELKKIVSKS
jgi:hypothetical protein